MGAKQTAYVTSIQTQINAGSAISATLNNLIIKALMAVNDGDVPGQNIQAEVQKLKPICTNLDAAIGRLEAHEKKMAKKWIGKKKLESGVKGALNLAKQARDSWERLLLTGEELRFRDGQN